MQWYLTTNQYQPTNIHVFRVTDDFEKRSFSCILFICKNKVWKIEAALSLGLTTEQPAEGTNGAHCCWGKGYMSHLCLLRGIVHLDVITLIPQLNCRVGQYFWLLHITTLTLKSWYLSMIRHNIKPTRPRIVVGTSFATKVTLVWYKCLYNHSGCVWWGSLRNYYISMVIYADPIHVCTPSSVHGSEQRLTGYAGVILFRVNYYWFTPYPTWLIRSSNDLGQSDGVTFI